MNAFFEVIRNKKNLGGGVIFAVKDNDAYRVTGFGPVAELFKRHHEKWLHDKFKIASWDSDREYKESELIDETVRLGRILWKVEEATVEDRPGLTILPILKIEDKNFFPRLMAQRNLGLGEAFIEGMFTMVLGSVHHFLGFILANELDREVKLKLSTKLHLLGTFVKWAWTHNHNEDIADHYDMADNIMIPMLGATGNYSCGYVLDEKETLDQMQINKLNLIFSKMQLKKGDHILDTGCGNGGALMHAALRYGCTGEGITNSFNMAALANRNAANNHLEGKVKILNQDFKYLAKYPDNTFDAIYEIGAWEHIPFKDYPFIMHHCHRILKPNGRMLIHSMATDRKNHQRDGYIQKYIFRDSQQISLYRLLEEASKSHMRTGDVENISRHYHHTCWYWRKNLLEARKKDPTINQKNFLIQWYFMESGMAESRYGDSSLYHILLFKNARDYLNLWRVDAKHVKGKEVKDSKSNKTVIDDGVMRREELAMIPNVYNAPENNDANSAGKFIKQIYRRPNPFARLKRVCDVLTSARFD